MIWFASPWDEGSVDFLSAFNPPCYKVSSACVTDIGLLNRIRDTGKPVIMSTGGSTPAQIQTAVDIFINPAILSCTALYPCSVGMTNLSKMDTLRKLYPGHIIGYSNHSPGLWMMLATVAKGAKMVEFHLTLDRSMWGSDQSASIETGGAIKIVKEIRDLERAVGDGILRCTEEEKPVMQKLRRFN
jgi:N-acetylneuraminate synthase